MGEFSFDPNLLSKSKVVKNSAQIRLQFCTGVAFNFHGKINVDGQLIA